MEYFKKQLLFMDKCVRVRIGKTEHGVMIKGTLIRVITKND